MAYVRPGTGPVYRKTRAELVKLLSTLDPRGVDAERPLLYPMGRSKELPAIVYPVTADDASTARP